MKTEKQEPFAIVPQALFSLTKFTPSQKLILSYMLGKYQTKLSNKEPWTFSNSSIYEDFEETIPKRTIEVALKKMVGESILKEYGVIKQNRTGHPLKVFTFNKNAFEKCLGVSAGIALTIEGVSAGNKTIYKTIDNNGLTDIITPSKNGVSAGIALTIEGVSAGVSAGVEHNRSKIIETNKEENKENKENSTNNISTNTGNFIKSHSDSVDSLSTQLTPEEEYELLKETLSKQKHVDPRRYYNPSPSRF